MIATPGRLIDHVKNTPTFSLENIEVGARLIGVMKNNQPVTSKNVDKLIDQAIVSSINLQPRQQVLILDEADRMLEEAFLEQMKEIVRSCARTRQTLLFSATMTDQVKNMHIAHPAPQP